MRTGLRWYKHLYMGSSVEGLRRTIRYEIKYRKYPAGYYLITLPACKTDLFDIWKSEDLCMPWMKKMSFDIIGIAGSKLEAIELAGSIILEVYQKTGSTNVSDYLGY